MNFQKRIFVILKTMSWVLLEKLEGLFHLNFLQKNAVLYNDIHTRVIILLCNHHCVGNCTHLLYLLTYYNNLLIKQLVKYFTLNNTNWVMCIANYICSKIVLVSLREYVTYSFLALFIHLSNFNTHCRDRVVQKKLC